MKILHVSDRISHLRCNCLPRLTVQISGLQNEAASRVLHKENLHTRLCLQIHQPVDLIINGMLHLDDLQHRILQSGVTIVALRHVRNRCCRMCCESLQPCQLLQLRVDLLVDVEYTSRKNNRLKRLIRKADFEQPDASVAAIDYHSGRKLNKSLIERMANCEYITECRNIFITGATGSGKT